MTIDSKALRNPRAAWRRLSRRSSHRRRRGADLSDDLLPVSGHRPRLAAVRAGGARATSTPACRTRRRTRSKTRIAALEGGAAALAVASGQTASAFSVLNLAQAGDNIVSSTDLYGGTWTLFSQTLKQFGIEVRFVDPSDPENFRRATDAKTRAYYAEILPNPKLNVFPIKEVADIGRSLGVPLIVDNTASPLIARPFEHGAAVVVYSATKYIGGHGTSIGGADRRRRQFPVGAACRALPAADPAGRGLSRRDLDRSRQAARPDRLRLARARQAVARLGAAISPFNAFQLHAGARDAAAAASPAQ